MANDPFGSSAIVATIKKNPIIFAAGLGGVGIAAFLATRSGGSTAPLAPAGSSTAPAGNPDLLGLGDSSAFPPGGSPYDGGPGAGYFDPFGGAGTDPYGGLPTDPGTTADGCSWPPPSIPAGYEGRGSWSCVQAQWTWNWITPPTPGPGPGPGPTGCPMPKPTLPTQLVGRYKYACVKGKWKLEPVNAPPPPPPPTQHPNVSKGAHATYAGHRNAKRKLILSDHRSITLAHAEHWTLSAAESGDRTPGKHGGEVKVRRIVAAPGHAGLVGRWLAV